MPSWLSGYREMIQEQAYYRSVLRWSFLGLNTLVYLGWTCATAAAYHGSGALVHFMADHFKLSRRNLREGRWWAYLTAAFSHKSFFTHRIPNVVAFHYYAPLALRAGLRPYQVVLLCVGSGVAGSMATVGYWELRGMADDDVSSITVANGVIWGLGMTTMLLRPRGHPRIPDDFMFWAVSCACFFSYDRLRVRRTNRESQYAAHAGGLSYGLAYYLYKSHTKSR